MMPILRKGSRVHKVKLLFGISMTSEERYLPITFDVGVRGITPILRKGSRVHKMNLLFGVNMISEEYYF